MIYQINVEGVINGQNYANEIVTTNLKGAYDFIKKHNNVGVNMKVKLWSFEGEQRGRRNNVVSMITKYNQATNLGVDFIILIHVLGCSLGEATHFLKK